MAKLMDWIKLPFTPIKPLDPGVYHYQSPPEDPLNYRLHLRVEEGGSGLLIINASTILHLNQTATEYAYHIVQETDHEEAVKIIKSRYQTSRKSIENDFAELKLQIGNLILTPDLDPITFLDIERHAPYSDEISAPYRLDCAITYKTHAGLDLDIASKKRVDRELSTEEWKEVIQKSWEAGIPHIIFTGGEPTFRDDLRELIAFAEDQGQVTGLLTDGIKLKDNQYLKGLLEAGLDHTMVILQPTNEESWESLTSFSYWSEIMEEDIYVSAHLTITEDNKESVDQIINRLASTGIAGLSLSINDHSLEEDLQNAQNLVYEQDLELIWDIPVPYSSLNPIHLELEANEEDRVITGEAKGWLYIEPDGDVLPSQGLNEVLGNLLSDSWDKIWEKARAFRVQQ
jgi:hypothetical protein